MNTLPTEPLGRALTDLAQEMPTARLPEGLWRQGIRRRNRRIAVAAAAAVLALLAAIPLVRVGTGRSATPPATPGQGVVPSHLHTPWAWQGTAQQAPNGSAAVLFSGGAFGMGTADLPMTYGSKLAVVGRDGSYRMLRYGRMYVQAGQQALLSPDGRYVAGPANIEKLFSTSEEESGVSVVDLVTGETRIISGVPSGEMVAWRPDGGALLVREPRYVEYPMNGTSYNVGERLWLVDIASGDVRIVFEKSGNSPPNRARYAAFSPDGKRLALHLGSQLYEVTLEAGTQRVITELSTGTALAGAGAWSPDGTGIMVFERQGCNDPCTTQQRNQRTWQMVRIDAASGERRTMPGYATVTGAAVRIAGWQPDGDAVVVVYHREQLQNDRSTSEQEAGDPVFYKSVGDVDLLALHADGRTTPLLAKPAGVIWDVDIAQDLLVADKFGGPSPSPGLLPAAPWFWVVWTLGGVLLAVPVLIRRYLRRRRVAKLLD